MRYDFDNRARSRESVDGFSSLSRKPRRQAKNGSLDRHNSSKQRGSHRSTNTTTATNKFPPITAHDMELPGEAKKPVQHHFMQQVWKWGTRSTTAVLVATLMVGGYLFSKGYLQLNKVFNGASNVSINTDVDPAQLKGEGSGRINILLLGIGGAGHDGADLTDTIMVASIDAINHKVDLLSVPRDLWVKEPNNFISNYGKINAAYESGKYKYLGKIDPDNSNAKAIDAGFQAADRTISKVLGIPIHYNALVNFHAFEQAVNAVNGVTVDVPEQLYDPTMAWQNNWNPVIAKKGVQHMSGRKALMYARSRKTSSDFARGERQRTILLALRGKALSTNTLKDPLKISDLFEALGDNVRTDLSLDDVKKLREIADKIQPNHIKSVDLDKPPNELMTTSNLNGQSIVVPKAGMFNYDDIRSFVRNTLRDGYLAKENSLVRVLNGTSNPGLATNTTEVLKSYGYRVAKPHNAPTGIYNKTVLVDMTHGRDKYTKHYLERRFGVKATTKLPQGVHSNKAGFVIILGQDETNLGE